MEDKVTRLSDEPSDNEPLKQDELAKKESLNEELAPKSPENEEALPSEDGGTPSAETEEVHTVERPKKKKYGWLGYVLLLAAIALGV